MVDGERFVWHYDAHCPFCSDDVMTAGKEGEGFVLFIDPWPWNMGITPKAVAAAVRWARAQGWSAETGPTAAVALVGDSETFEWLPEGARHVGCRPPAPEDN